LHGREWIHGLAPAKNVGTNIAAEIESILAEIEGREASPSIAFEAAVQTRLEKKDLKQPEGTNTPKKIANTSTSFERSPEVKAWVLRSSNGICEGCQQPAPFVTSTGQFFWKSTTFELWQMGAAIGLKMLWLSVRTVIEPFIPAGTKTK